MIEVIKGDIFDLRVEALVNPVNCDGVMGKGLALEFKRRFPHMYTLYKAACRNKALRPGLLHVYVNLSARRPFEPNYIINFPTKDHWFEGSNIFDVNRGLHELAKAIHDLKLESIALPALGCGLGGLKWEEVMPLIRRHLDDTRTAVYLIEPK